MNVRAAVVLVIAAVAVFVGSCAHSRYKLEERVSEFARQAKTICSTGRGAVAAEPTREQLAARIRSLAEEVDLTVLDVAVSIGKLDGTVQSGLDGMVQQQLQAFTGGKLEMTGVLVTARTRVHGERWLWSVDRDVESSCVVKRRLERKEDKRVRDTAAGVRDRARTIGGR